MAVEPSLLHANGHAGDGREPVSPRAVILAGGRGTRLAPYTSVLPKPLMPVGDRAILELVVDQLAECGISDVTFCVGYLSHLIRAVFDNRANGHVKVRYVQEQDALGTAGPLRLVDGLDDTFVVMNGDVLTTLDYGDLLRYHREQGNALTIATRDRSIKIDYGVLELDDATGAQISGYREKPEMVSTVSMGIYVLEPWVLRYVPEGRPFDVPDLVQVLLREGHRLGAYRYEGMWFDIGREEDYQQAVAAWLDGSAERALHANGHGHANGNGNGHANGNSHGHTNGNGNGHAKTDIVAAVAAANGNGNGGGEMNADLRETLSRIPRQVTIVTTQAGEQTHATTVSSFTSLSADPPLVTVSLKRDSRLLELIEESGRFAVNLLAKGQEDVGRVCAEKGEDKLASVEWEDVDGLPRIAGSAGWISCDVQEYLPGGDHVIVVGLVTASEAADEAQPLLYHRRRYLDVVA
jgi:flavin reductase (DIM6/NTAB) family NADH-FMN oxidoreductase RutF/dTDP-glucose pyrophosphorylase